MTTLRELAPIILQKSRDGKIPGEEGGGKSFIANLGDWILRILYDERSETVDHRLRLLDAAGNTMESFSSTRDKDEGKVLSEIYELARRKALRVDEALGALEKTLMDL